jgi:hypothetical protein
MRARSSQAETQSMCPWRSSSRYSCMRLLQVSQFVTSVNTFSDQTRQFPSTYTAAFLQLTNTMFFQDISNRFSSHSLPHQYIPHMSDSLMRTALLLSKLFETRSSFHFLQMLSVLLMARTLCAILSARIAMLPGTARAISPKTALPRVPSIYPSLTC